MFGHRVEGTGAPLLQVLELRCRSQGSFIRGCFGSYEVGLLAWNLHHETTTASLDRCRGRDAASELQTNQTLKTQLHL